MILEVELRIWLHDHSGHNETIFVACSDGFHEPGSSQGLLILQVGQLRHVDVGRASRKRGERKALAHSEWCLEMVVVLGCWAMLMPRSPHIGRGCVCDVQSSPCEVHLRVSSDVGRAWTAIQVIAVICASGAALVVIFHTSRLPRH
jgi:hypothetical protein